MTKRGGFWKEEWEGSRRLESWEIFEPGNFELGCRPVLVSQVRVEFFTCWGYTSSEEAFPLLYFRKKKRACENKNQCFVDFERLSDNSVLF